MSDELDELDEELPLLKVTCTSFDCQSDLHCFLKKRGMPVEEWGNCRGCNADLVDWKRLHQRDADDLDYTFEALRKEMIRHHMWTIPIDTEAERKARMRGKEDLYGSIRRRLLSSIGRSRGGFDGRQTRMSGNVIYYAQHATATCCRKCLHYWHGIPMERSLKDEELDYCEALIEAYLDQRLPDLQDGKRPELRKKSRAA